jgi:hypothetical protein
LADSANFFHVNANLIVSAIAVRQQGDRGSLPHDISHQEDKWLDIRASGLRAHLVVEAGH